MRLRLLPPLLIVVSGLSLGSGLFAQTTAPAGPPRPSIGDLKEEQRIIDNAYLARGENFVGKSKEQIVDNLLRPAKENAFYAVELLSRARKLLDQHPSRIEQASGLFGRAFESSRESLRKNLREKIDPRYFDLQGKLEGLAGILAGKGDASVQQALDAAKIGDTARVEQLMRAQGITPKEPAESAGLAAPAAGPMPGIPGATATQAGPGQVALNIPSVGQVNVPGTLSADGRYVDSPEFGRIDLSSGKLLPDGSVAFQSDKGLVIRGRDGKWHLASGAQLNDDGTATTADGKRVPAESLAGGSAPAGGLNPAAFSGTLPPGTIVLDQNGNRITVDPTWQNGEQTGVKKEYIGGAGATLVSETKVTRKLVQANGNEWRVNVTPGESRTWNFSVRMGEPKSANGVVTLTLTVDGGGPTGSTIRSWEIADDKGNRASVTPSANNPAEAVATFAKGGEYTFTVTGETDWGSPFRVKGQGGVYP